ncbi:DUF4189 domain-containing protein [Pseudoxanthomonas winnipegensis]|uniref:DUF4189 domain-containing protein n=1 Tax=Pseudoxanthomonas winnipegensis TaxID=2480810 RepID=A0A4Q8LE74_9GAMM|nr:DUF4189 domain-containing protein [Pseudoxanthomonas winnipegensis]RZZ88963.1 DUF4189 domain-containing protein [Pseudoxanthomonas winnipegensis]TAA27328.1 DUF4189 domain-containing protein [Pseudoxanthomonas winnipegensis]TAA38951.1 DUF4189 domain-containing protein [Pseudoxanthomonas winnipegensis]TBV75614.1 DUF4189 domain-containing protein [Pseudoxanthomonas winnipegensis]
MKAFAIAVLLVFGLPLSPAALAQDSVQQQQQQFQAEQNRLGYYNGQVSGIPLPPRPAGKWIKTWGAIAKEFDGPNLGVSSGELSKSKAEQQAVNQCLSAGGRTCKAIFAYRNQCVAYASRRRADGRWQEGPVTAESIELASRLSLQDCADYGGNDCKIVYTACTDPIFERY